jgi:hypothetical protein
MQGNSLKFRKLLFGITPEAIDPINVIVSYGISFRIETNFVIIAEAFQGLEGAQSIDKKAVLSRVRRNLLHQRQRSDFFDWCSSGQLSALKNPEDNLSISPSTHRG